MTRLGTLIFSALGLLFVAFVAGMIWLATRGDRQARATLEAHGWTFSGNEGSGPDGVRVEERHAGVKTQTTVLEVWVAVDDAKAQVVVVRPGQSLFGGAQLPAAWPGFQGGADAFATDDASARRWLPPKSQAAIVERFAAVPRMVSVRVRDGRLTVVLQGGVEDAAAIESAAALVLALRAGAAP